MKKIIYLVCVAQLLFACGKEKVRQEQVRKEESNEKKQNENKTETPAQPSQPAEAPAPAEPKVERPSDYILGSRLVVEWNKNVDYLAKLDLDEAIATGSAKSLSWEVLRPYLHLYSTHQDGRVYELTNEDLNDISLSSIKYSSSEYTKDEITFVAKYKGISAQGKPVLTFSKQDYFSKRIKPNSEFIKTKFVSGIYRDLSPWGGNLFSYDQDKYGVLVTNEGKSVNHSRDELSLMANVVMRKYGNVETSKINFNLDGFKPLSSLKGKLVAIAQPELRDYFKRNEKLRLNLDFLNANFKVWRKYLEFGIKQGERSWSELRPKQDNPLILEGTNHGGVDLRDLYLESPVFEVVKAELVGDDLIYTLQFRGVNESVSFTDFPLTVRVLVRK
jgi:lipoprotein